MSKYHRNVPKGVASVDVYRVLRMFGVTDPAIQHAIKKLLMAGQRGHKGKHEDLFEAIQAIQRSIEMDLEDSRDN